jgi:vacuolar-type H+-ATPase subunit I/STV1
MYCRKCGKAIEGDSEFCRYCGAKVDSEIPVSNSSLEDEFSDVNKQYSENQSFDKGTFIAVKMQPLMKWYKALVRFFIPAALILRPIESVGSLQLNISQYYGTWQNYFTHPIDGIPNTLNIVLWLLGIILLLFAFIGIREFTDIGYKLIMIYFIFNAIYPIASALIYIPSYIKVGLDFDYGPTVAQFIINSIVSIPNLIYFKKRSYLFAEERVHNI